MSDTPLQNTEIKQKSTKNKKRKGLLVIFLLIVTILPIYLIYYFNSESFFNAQLVRPGKYLSINLPQFPQTHSNGFLYKTPEGLIIFELNGTEAEMGFAHGYILGNQIKYSVEYTLRVIGSLSTYKNVHDSLLPEYLLINSTNYLEEIEGIVSGAIASNSDRYVSSLKRNWDAMDLWMLNTIQDWYQVACSGVGVWGSSSATGQTILSRNLDFYNDRNGYINQLYTVMIFRGNSTPGPNFRYDVVSFSFPGIISVLSGFNSKGVWIHCDSSNGDMTSEYERTGVNFAIRRFLEKEDGTDIANRSQNYFLQQNIAHSVLLLVGSNNSFAENSNPVFVLEVRDKVVGYRGEANTTDNYVVVTNHERINQDPIDCYRYSRYISDFTDYKSNQDQKIDAEELLISQQHCGHVGSINTIQFYPANLTFRIGYTRIMDVPYGKQWSDKNLVGGPWDPLLNTWFSFIL